MRPILIFLIAFPLVVSAQSWKDRVEVFASVEEMTAPEGYRVYSSPGGRVVKSVTKSESINTKASLVYQGKRYFMSDWSWSRYSSGKEPYWILVRGAEAADEAADEAEEAEETPVATAEAVPREAVKIERPLTVPEKLERRWDGVLEVFPSSRSFPAPKGYRLLADPNSGDRALKSTSSKTRISARAALTRQDGMVYYISDWSWSRTVKGYDPNWMFITGSKPKSPEQIAKQTKPEPKTAPAPAAAGLEAPSLVEKVMQMARPTISLDEVDASGRMVALLVGNGSYSSANRTQRMLDLADPALNVDLLAKAMKSLKAEVRVEKNLDRKALAAAIQETVSGLEAGDVFLFYYAGHALQLSGKNYLAPLGINFLDRTAVRSSAYPLDDLLDPLDSKSLRFAGVFLDGCRKNPFNSKDSSFYILSRIPGLNLSSSGGAKPGLAAEKARRNTLIGFAAAPGQIASESKHEAKHSRYAGALASALAENVEIRDAMGTVRSQVAEWTSGEQTPWTAEGELAQFFLHTPGRSSLDPDGAVQKAGQWVAREQERGVAMATALLARSVREQPENNPATAALLYLLSYQSIPVPLQTWGPFDGGSGSYSPELQVSIDGRYVALYPEGADEPSLILDRDKGKVIPSVYESFAPGFGTVSVALERLASYTPQSGAPVSVISIKHLEEGDGNSDPQASSYAAAPILSAGSLVASYYDEGLERFFLVLRDEQQKLSFCEFATTPSVACRDDFRVVAERMDLTQEGDQTLLSGTVPAGEEGAGQEWQLMFAPSAGEVRFLRAGQVKYRKSGVQGAKGVLDDWRVDPSANAMVLLYRNQVDFLTLGGTKVSQIELKPAAHSARSIMSFHPAFRRLAIASSPSGKDEEGRKDISMYDLSSGRRLGGSQPLVGYAEFAGLSPDQEWFFYYDTQRRMRMVDVVSGGAKINFPATPTLQPLPVGAELEPEAPIEEDFFAYELGHPPLLEGWGSSPEAPAWLADLAEALVGFKVNERNEVEWFADTPKRIRSTVQQMRKKSRDEVHESWAQWMLDHRLGMVGS